MIPESGLLTYALVGLLMVVGKLLRNESRSLSVGLLCAILVPHAGSLIAAVLLVVALRIVDLVGAR